MEKHPVAKDNVNDLIQPSTRRSATVPCSHFLEENSRMSSSKPMNMLILFSDQHNREKTGCYGDPYIHTPNIDRLAANGVRFANAYTNNPICVPARAALVNGDYCFRHSYWDNAHPYAGREEGWGHRLTQQGYPVVTVGKLHYKDNIPETGFPDQRIPLNVKGAIGDVSHTIRDGTMRRHFLREEIFSAGEGDSEYLRYDANVAERAVDFLRNEGRGSDKPWCLFVGFVCPHFPWRVPKDIMDLYRPYDKLPFPRQWRIGERPMHPALEGFRREFCMEGDIPDDVVRQAVATYYGMITYMDRQVGKVLDALAESGLENETRIIYTDDHGDTAGDHGLFFKHSMYEGSAGVPLIVAGPDIPKGKVAEQCVSLVDVFPTVLDCVGAKPKPEDAALPGVSLLEIARGERTEDRPVFSEYHAVGFDRGVFMLRRREWKLIYYVGYEPQLFNLHDDPGETKDLASDPAHREIRLQMEAELRKICDPEEVDRRAKTEQQALLERHGGREAVIEKGFFSYSPVPEGSA